MSNDFKVGSILRFSELAQKDISNEEFRICKIGRYKFKNVTSNSFLIQGFAGKFCFTDSADDEDYFSLSRLINSEFLPKIFDLRDLAGVFSDKIDFDIKTKKKIEKPWVDWVEKVYTKSFDYSKGIWYESCEIEEGEVFYYYMLNAENSSLDIEIFDSGKILFYMTVYISKESVKVKHG